MSGKELQKLTKSELIDIIYSLKEKNLRLLEENQGLKAKENISEAEVTDNCGESDTILEELREMHSETATQLERIRCLEAAVRCKCRKMLDDTDAECKKRIADTDKEIMAKWSEFKTKLQKFVSDRAELKEILNR